MRKLPFQVLLTVSDDDAFVVFVHPHSQQIVGFGIVNTLRGVHVLYACGRRTDETDLVYVDIRVINSDAERLLSLCQFHFQLAFHGRIGVPAASVRHSDRAEIIELTVVRDPDTEARAVQARRHRSLVGIRASLLHVHGVLKPFAGSCVSDGITAVACNDVHTSTVVAIVCATFVFRVAVVI